jgi:stress response protein YsnF
LLRQHGAYDIESGRTPSEDRSLTSPGAESVDGAAARTLELRAEELQARTTSVETGQVSVGKEVVECEPRSKSR